jgi:hypothetical protein
MLPDWHSWIGSPTAWLALFLSVINAFNTFFYYSDNLTVVISKPKVTKDNDNNWVIMNPASFLFINNGSRPLAVSGGEVGIKRANVGSADLECSGQPRSAVYHPVKLERKVIKPHDIISVEIENPGIAGVAEDYRSTGELMVFCMRFQVQSVDISFRKVIEVGRIYFESSGLAEQRGVSASDAPVTATLISRDFWSVIRGSPPPHFEF